MRRGSTQKALDVPPFDVVLDMQGASSLGIGLNDLNYICSIEPGSVASKHGLQLGDQVLAWQGELLGGQLLTKVLVPSPVHKFSIKRSPFGLHTVQILVHGCLQKKQPSGLRQWQTRWFELSQVDLVYYAGQKDEEPRGVIPLKNVRSVERSSDGKKFVVSVEDLLPGSGKRAFELQAASSLVRERWVRALQMLTRGNDVRMQEEAAAATAAEAAAASGPFGAPLDECELVAHASGWSVPALLAALWDALSARGDDGLTTEGIFRLSADASEVEATRQKLRVRATGAAGAAAALDGVSGVCLAALIKALLREMPDDLWASVRPQLADTMADESASALDVARALPEREAHLVGFCLHLMASVVAHQAVNRMTPKAIATVIAPNLLKCTETDDPMAMLTAMAASNKLVERLLNEHLATPLAPPAAASRASAAAPSPDTPSSAKSRPSRISVSAPRTTSFNPTASFTPKGLDEGPLAAAAGVEDNDAQLERLASLPSAYMLGPNMSLLRKRKIDPAAGLQSSILEDFSELSVQGGTEEI